MSHRPLIGGFVLFMLILLMNACGTAESVREAPTLRLTAVDSKTGEPLDSAEVWNRRTGDTTDVGSGEPFALQEPSPTLYVFDIDGYGFHRHRHFSVLVEPDDKSIFLDAPLRPKQLSIDCQSARALYKEDLSHAVDQDSNGVQLRLLNTLARNGQVQVQPAVVNNFDIPIFVPKNFGPLGHYSIRLVDEDGNELSYEYEDGPPKQDHRIYSETDILPVVPGETERLRKYILTLQEEIEEGTTIYAHMGYDFSLSDTLQATSATPFPAVHLDSLHVPHYDTLRVKGQIQAADSLVLKQDTTVMEITGIDTTVTRDGYLLYSTRRDSNTTPTAEAARSLLFVPDSVKERVRRDSLATEPPIASIPPEEQDLHVPLPSEPILNLPPTIVHRRNRSRLNDIIRDSTLVDALTSGLPRLHVSADSLLNLPESLRETYLSTPDLPRKKIHRGVSPNTSASNTPSLQVLPDNSLPVSLSPEGSSLLSSVSPPVPDSIPFDSLSLTVPSEADSFVTGSVVDAYLDTPPQHSYWYVPDSLTADKTRVMVIDSTFRHLRARPYVDTTYTHYEALIPDRLGQPDTSTHLRFPQQVITAPTGGYRTQYLRAWRQFQQRRLRNHYCQIYPYPLESRWRTMAMH